MVRVRCQPFHAEVNNVIYTVLDGGGICNRINEILRLMKSTEETGSIDKRRYQNINRWIVVAYPLTVVNYLVMRSS